MHLRASLGASFESVSGRSRSHQITCKIAARSGWARLPANDKLLL